MKAMLVPVGEEPRLVDFDGSMEDIQRYVGGYFDAAGWIFDDSPAVYLNDEGKFCASPNRAVYARQQDAGKMLWSSPDPLREGDLVDVIYGDFLCVGFDPRTGEDRDISDEEARRVVDRFGGPASIDSGFIEVMGIKLSAARR